MTSNPIVYKKIAASRCRTGGFSLIEMLVVVGIVCVLVGLLFGVGRGYSNFKARAKTELLLNAACSAENKLELSYGHPLDHMEAQYYRVINTAAGVDRVMTPMEYFVFKSYLASTAYRQLQGVSELVVNSTALAGRPTSAPSFSSASRAIMVKVVFIHQDKENPSAPWLQDIVVDYAPPVSPGYPLSTLIDGWGHEIEYRSMRQDAYWDSNNDGVSDAPNEPFTPGAWASYQGFAGWPGLGGPGWTAAAGLPSSGFDVKYGFAADPMANRVANPVNPAMPDCDFAYFASAGPDGLWGSLAGHRSGQPDSAAKDNLYSNTPNAN